ncbi:MAG TPA: hypothetical protein VF815_46845 [Myxococcaceae bacterium]
MSRYLHERPEGKLLHDPLADAAITSVDKARVPGVLIGGAHRVLTYPSGSPVP